MSPSRTSNLTPRFYGVLAHAKPFGKDSRVLATLLPILLLAAVDATGSVEAGATATSGNTDVQTYTGALKADAKTDGWGLALRSSGVYASSHHVQTAGSWDTSLRGDRAIIGKLSGYAKLSIDGDRFKGIDNRKGAGAGLAAATTWRDEGADFDHDALRAELGYQYYRVDLARTTKDQEIEAGRAFAGYKHAFQKETTFSEEDEALYDFKVKDRVLLTSVTALTVRLRAHLSFKASETVKVDSVPDLRDPADPTQGRFKRTDTLTAFAAIVTF